MPYVAPIFQRCMRLVETTLEHMALYERDPLRASQMPEPNKDFLIVALDLLSALVEAAGPEIATQVASTKILDQLSVCVMDSMAEVRQSALAVLGDLTKACYACVEPHVPRFLPALHANLDPTLVRVCNNSVWALGEIAVHTGASLREFVPHVLPTLIALIGNGSESRPAMLLENVAITLGRLSMCCADLIAPELPRFIVPWCLLTTNMRDNSEKYSAFRGICTAIQHNPGALDERALVLLCVAISTWEAPPQDLRSLFVQLLGHYFRGVTQQRLDGLLCLLPLAAPLQHTLRSKLAEYGVCTSSTTTS